MPIQPINRPPSPHTILDVLREQTRIAHQNMHQHPRMANLLTSSCDLQDYQTLLLAYHGLYSILEHRLCSAISQLNINFDYHSRLKSPWLVQDLEYFDLSPIVSAVGEVNSPVIDDVPTLIGVLYVVEGSTLGGQVIARQLRTSLQLTAERGGRFFSGYGDKTAENWQNFVVFANSSLMLDAEAIVVEAAKATFALFRQALDISYGRAV